MRDMPTDWEALVARGEASARLLRVLWRGETENHRFLLLLVQKLGLFAPLAQERGEYLVPATVSAVFASESKSYVTRQDIESHLGHEGQQYSFDFRGFLPNGTFERIVVNLVIIWNDATSKRPCVIPGGALLALGDVPVVLINDSAGHRMHVQVNKDAARSVLAHVKNTIDAINTRMYSNRLSFEVPEIDTEVQVREGHPGGVSTFWDAIHDDKKGAQEQNEYDGTDLSLIHI